MSSLYPCVSDYPYSDDDVAEPNDGTVMVDTSGYIDPSTYIAQMLEAGIMLDQIRRGEYDYDGDDDDIDPDIDPLRAPWTDPADVDAFANGLQQTLENKKAAADRLKAATANASNDASANTSILPDPSVPSGDSK